MSRDKQGGRRRATAVVRVPASKTVRRQACPLYLPPRPRRREETRRQRASMRGVGETEWKNRRAGNGWARAAGARRPFFCGGRRQPRRSERDGIGGSPEFRGSCPLGSRRARRSRRPAFSCHKRRFSAFTSRNSAVCNRASRRSAHSSAESLRQRGHWKRIAASPSSSLSDCSEDASSGCCRRFHS